MCTVNIVDRSVEKRHSKAESCNPNEFPVILVEGGIVLSQADCHCDTGDQKQKADHCIQDRQQIEKVRCVLIFTFAGFCLDHYGRRNEEEHRH